MGVRCTQATAMLNTEPHRIEGRFASVLQAASPRVFSAGARARDDSSAAALYGCSHRWRTEKPKAFAKTCAKLAHKYSSRADSHREHVAGDVCLQ